MKIEVNDNLKWFLESLINEGFDKFIIDDMYGVVFTGPKKEFDPIVNFLTSEMFKACPELKENTEYSIKDFLDGEIDENNFKFGDKVFITLAGEKIECVFLKYKTKTHSLVITPLLEIASIKTKNLKLPEEG